MRQILCLLNADMATDEDGEDGTGTINGATAMSFDLCETFHINVPMHIYQPLNVLLPILRLPNDDFLECLALALTGLFHTYKPHARLRYVRSNQSAVSPSPYLTIPIFLEATSKLYSYSNNDSRKRYAA